MNADDRMRDTMLTVILDAYEDQPLELERELRSQANVHLNGADALEYLGSFDDAAKARELADQCMTCANLTRKPFDEMAITAILDAELGLLIIAFSAATLVYKPRP